jgi:hypothetical protein
VDFGLFCWIYAVKGKEISIFCRFELENMSIYEILPALDLTQSVHRNAPGGQIKNFKNTLDRA